MVPRPAMPPRTPAQSIGSQAGCWPLAATSASISASGVPAFAESTSSSGSYSVTPLRPERSSVRSVCAGRPIARLEPWPTISAALPSASSHCTAASTSLASRARRVSAIARLSSACRSESRDIRKRHAAGVNMQAPKLGAAVQRRENLAGIEQAALVEGAFEPLLMLEIGIREHRRHRIALLDPDTVLAGEHAPHLDAVLEDVGPEAFRLLELARLVAIVENERVEIAVAGMEHVGDAQPVALGQFAHAPEHLRQARPRDGAVHAVIVRRDAADRRKRRLAPGQEQEPLLLRGGAATGHGASGLRDRLDLREEMIDLSAWTVELHDQQSLDVERISRVHEFLDRVDRRRVHHFHAAGDDAGADDPAHAFAGILGRSEPDQHGARAFRLLEQAHGDLGDDAEQPLRAG